MTISNPAKILAAYMRCSGISDAKQLAADLDIPLRTIQRLKLEVAVGANDANDAMGAISGAEKAPNAPTTPDMAPPTAPDMAPLARAHKESPSEIIITQSVKTREVEQEPAGWSDLKTAFNGSTEAMLADVQAYMGPLATRQDAVKWLSGTVSAYGSQRTAQAWTIVTTKRAQGEIVPSPLPLWAKTANGLKTGQSAKPRMPSRW